MKKIFTFTFIALMSIFGQAGMSIAAQPSALEVFEPNSRFIQVKAKTKQQRTQIANMGVSIEFVRSDSVWGFAMPSMVTALEKKGFRVLGNFDREVARGGHEGILLDFPNSDSIYHNLDEALEMLQKFQADNPELVRLSSIGKTHEGRDIWAIHINTTAKDLDSGVSTKPGAIFMGEHHAREHLSAEVPLMFIDYLLKNKADPEVKKLLESRDIWVVPIVNPDGKNFDIATGRYQMWRKNRRNNGDGTFGVDLNRNYSFGWGTGGSSTNTSSDVYMGKAPFSEPETQAIRDFVRGKSNTKVLLTFHTFSELILYPWGGKYDPISNKKDLAAFESMANTMAGWNKYTPQQSSDLYIASGDTVDWAYGELGIFAFTFELSPASMGAGGFYPGPQMVEKAFKANLKPCLYLLDMADDPYKSILDSPATPPTTPPSNPGSVWPGRPAAGYSRAYLGF
jgi:carboxypeptidase T